MADAALSQAKSLFAFTCNLCSTGVRSYALDELVREGGVCPACGANVRCRALVHLVSIALFRRSLIATAWPGVDKTLIGISDWPGFERFFRRAVRYTNTQYDLQGYPDATFLDICAPRGPLAGTADIVTCSDVLEHVVPPVDRAFAGLFELLKPGGTLIFTVPYSLTSTVEHFPNLHDWKLEGTPDARILRNVTAQGVHEEFRDLCFHGGGDAVLEMRLFGLPDLIDQLVGAGFVEIEVLGTDVLGFGIRLEPWSRPISARRPL